MVVCKNFLLLLIGNLGRTQFAPTILTLRFSPYDSHPAILTLRFSILKTALMYDIIIFHESKLNERR